MGECFNQQNFLLGQTSPESSDPGMSLTAYVGSNPTMTSNQGPIAQWLVAVGS